MASNKLERLAFVLCLCVGCVNLVSLAHLSEPILSGKMDTRMFTVSPRGSLEDGTEQFK